MDPRDAEIEARRMFGNAAAIREEMGHVGIPSIGYLAGRPLWRAAARRSPL
jgi:hypothetical protein